MKFILTLLGLIAFSLCVNTQKAIAYHLIHSGYTVVEDSVNGSYCFAESDNKIIYFESPKNVADKTLYAMNNGLNGVFVWELGGDNIEQVLSSQIVCPERPWR